MPKNNKKNKSKVRRVDVKEGASEEAGNIVEGQLSEARVALSRLPLPPATTEETRMEVEEEKSGGAKRKAKGSDKGASDSESNPGSGSGSDSGEGVELAEGKRGEYVVPPPPISSGSSWGQSKMERVAKTGEVVKGISRGYLHMHPGYLGVRVEELSPDELDERFKHFLRRLFPIDGCEELDEEDLTYLMVVEEAEDELINKAIKLEEERRKLVSRMMSYKRERDEEREGRERETERQTARVKELEEGLRAERDSSLKLRERVEELEKRLAGGGRPPPPQRSRKWRWRFPIPPRRGTEKEG